MISLIQESLETLRVRCKRPDVTLNGNGVLRLRIGGYDDRNVPFQGWVELEPYTYRGAEGSFCIMQRDVVSGYSFTFFRERGMMMMMMMMMIGRRETRYRGDGFGNL